MTVLAVLSYYVEAEVCTTFVFDAVAFEGDFLLIEDNKLFGAALFFVFVFFLLLFGFILCRLGIRCY